MNIPKEFTYNELFSLAIKKPESAQLEVTRNCPQSCFFCFRQCNPDIKFKTKSLAHWKGAINKLVAIGVNKINFSGGEIFLFPNISELFHYAKKQGIGTLVVNTNGIINLKKHDIDIIDELVFSIHGIKKDHDNITNFPHSFEKALESINYALSKKCHVGINTVVIPENINKLNSIYNFFKKLDINFHSFNLSIDQNKISQNPHKQKKLICSYLKFIKKLPTRRRKLRHGMQNVIWEKKSFKSAIPLPHCAAGKYKLCIDYQGDIYPCRYFQTDQYKCGNVFKDDLEKVWKNGKGFKLFREMILKNDMPIECTTCYKKYKCRGGCLAWRIYNPKLKQYGRDIRCKFGNAHIRN